MIRLFAAIYAGQFGWFVGKALNVPVWSDWDIGDRSDMALVAFLAAWFGIRAARASLNSDPTRGGER